MKPSVVDVESHLRSNIHFEHIRVAINAYLIYQTIMNIFEFRNLLNNEDRKEKRKSFLRSLIKPVETGANGTQDYVVKKGPGKNKIATTRQ